MSCLMCCVESEGTLILPTVESSQRLQDDDATTITSDDSFFSAAEVRTQAHTHTFGTRPARFADLSLLLLRSLSLSGSLTLCPSLIFQLFDSFSLEEVYQPLKPAALYEEALTLVREAKVTCRSFR